MLPGAKGEIELLLLGREVDEVPPVFDNEEIPPGTCVDIAVLPVSADDMLPGSDTDEVPPEAERLEVPTLDELIGATPVVDPIGEESGPTEDEVIPGGEDDMLLPEADPRVGGGYVVGGFGGM